MWEAYEVEACVGHISERALWWYVVLPWRCVVCVLGVRVRSVCRRCVCVLEVCRGIWKVWEWRCLLSGFIYAMVRVGWRVWGCMSV